MKDPLIKNPLIHAGQEPTHSATRRRNEVPRVQEPFPVAWQVLAEYSPIDEIWRNILREALLHRHHPLPFPLQEWRRISVQAAAVLRPCCGTPRLPFIHGHRGRASPQGLGSLCVNKYSTYLGRDRGWMSGSAHFGAVDPWGCRTCVQLPGMGAPCQEQILWASRFSAFPELRKENGGVAGPESESDAWN